MQTTSFYEVAHAAPVHKATQVRLLAMTNKLSTTVISITFFLHESGGTVECPLASK